MMQHSRLHVRNQRERWIAKRRRKFAHWLPLALGQTTPLEAREAEYWTERLGKFAKWAGGPSRRRRAAQRLSSWQYLKWLRSQ